MKRFLSVTVAICLLLSIWTVPAIADGERKSGLFTYELKGNGNAVITRFDWGANGGNDIYVPRQIDGYTVTEIGEYAFSSKDAVLVTWVQKNGSDFSSMLGEKVVVVLPDTITMIGEKAFFCTSITSVTIPASVQLIGSGAFAGCNFLKQHSVASENSVYTTIDGVLYNKTNKELVSFPSGYENVDSRGFAIPDGIISIGEYAFAGVNCRNDGKITIPSSVTQIKDYAFTAACLYSFIGSDVVEIGPHAFEGAKMNYDYKHPVGWPFQKLETIGDYAFSNAEFDHDMAEYPHILSFPQTLKHIGVGAFKNIGDYSTQFIIDLSQTGLTSISAYTFDGSMLAGVLLPNTLTTIEENSFAFVCSQNQLNIAVSINLPNSVETIGPHAFECTKLTFEIAEGSQLRQIADFAFKGACFFNDPKEVNLPEGLESIGEGAFESSNLDIITIPNTVTEIGDTVCTRGVTQLKVTAGSYAALYANENGYPVLGAGEEDTSWLNS